MTQGSRIAQLRKHKGLTQSQFAKLAGISASTVAMYETNRRSPDPATLEKLANALDVSADSFGLELDATPEPPAHEPKEEAKPEASPIPELWPTSAQVTSFTLSREEARLILFLRMNPECAPFLESYILADPGRRAQLEKTWRLIKEFQV